MAPLIYNNFDSIEYDFSDGIYSCLDGLILFSDYQGFDTYLSTIQSFDLPDDISSVD